MGERIVTEIHKGCGGEIVKRVCNKCGAKWNPVKYIFTNKIEIPEPKGFDPQEYRKRIRQGKDLP